MLKHDSELLTLVSKQCFFRHQPQPLVDLLNKRGIVGRQAEVFWTYFNWGFQNGTFSCQLSSAYVAELLFTDIRTVQRANERLQDAGLITRARAEKSRGTHLEAPAITTIAIPDEDARQALSEAPKRGAKQSKPQGISPKPAKEFTAVNSNRNDRPANSKAAPSPTSPKPYNAQDKNEHKHSGDLSEIKARLPEKVQRIHDMCMVKASPGVFRSVLDELGGVSDSDAETLMKPLQHALELKRKEVSEAQQRSSAPQNKPGRFETNTRPTKRPDDPRPIPETAVSLIKKRLQTTAPESGQGNRSLAALASEVVYSITIGTMRGVDVMHAINATIKLIATKRWSRPRGMPEGWRFDHVVMGTA